MKLLAKSFVLALALLIAAEAAVRFFFAQNMSGRFEYGYHPTAGFVEKEDGTVQLVRAGGRRFRPQSFRMPKPEGTFRIFTIGGSVPRGPTLEWAYANRLGELLREKGIQAESFNLGVAGYGSRRSRVVFRQVLKYEPDLVVLHLGDSNEYEDDREWRRKEEFASWHPKNWLMKSFLLRRLYELKTEKVFWKLLKHDIRRQTAMNDADAEIAVSNNEETRRKWRRRAGEVALEIVREARRADVNALVLLRAIVPKVEEGEEPFLDDADFEKWKAPLEQEGAIVVSMKEIFEEVENFQEKFSDGSHLRASGHQKVAEVLAARLVSAGFLTGFTKLKQNLQN